MRYCPAQGDALLSLMKDVARQRTSAQLASKRLMASLSFVQSELQATLAPPVSTARRAPPRMHSVGTQTAEVLHDEDEEETSPPPSPQRLLFATPKAPRKRTRLVGQGLRV